MPSLHSIFPLDTFCSECFILICLSKFDLLPYDLSQKVQFIDLESEIVCLLRCGCVLGDEADILGLKEYFLLLKCSLKMGLRCGCVLGDEAWSIFFC